LVLERKKKLVYHKKKRWPLDVKRGDSVFVREEENLSRKRCEGGGGVGRKLKGGREKKNEGTSVN